MKRRPFSVDKVMVDIGFTIMALFAMMLAMAKIESQTQVAKDAAAMKLGNIAVEVQWPDGMNSDVDLWVKAPRDDAPVGYNRRADRQSAYVRDDIGQSNDLSDSNFENAFIRGLVAGRYIINVHCYAKRDEAEIPVTITAAFTPNTGPSVQIAKRDIKLAFDGQEVTAFSFELDDSGKLIEGSISQNYIPLRSGDHE